MNALLWTLVIVAGVNTLAVMIVAATGEFPPMTMRARAVDWVLTAALGCWALWLLARQS